MLAQQRRVPTPGARSGAASVEKRDADPSCRVTSGCGCARVLSACGEVSCSISTASCMRLRSAACACVHSMIKGMHTLCMQAGPLGCFTHTVPSILHLHDRFTAVCVLVYV